MGHSSGAPTVQAENGAWFCTWRILGLDEAIGQTAGVDAFQALELVMVMIGANLRAILNGYAGRLRWPGESQSTNDTGFPKSVR